MFPRPEQSGGAEGADAAPRHRPGTPPGYTGGMNILVTGGAGYIGSVTVEGLVRRGHRVVVLDNLGSGHREAVHPDAAFVLADLRDTDRVSHALEQHAVEAVVHFAASSLVGESMQVPLAYYENNVGGSLSLLRAVTAAGIDRFVFSSTAALYGTPDATPIPEDAPIRPESVYGSTKRMVEEVLGWLSADVVLVIRERHLHRLAHQGRRRKVHDRLHRMLLQGVRDAVRVA